MSNSVIFSPGTFFHGTKADLSVGICWCRGIYLIMMKTGLPTMFILQGPWTLPSGEQSWLREMESSGFLLWSQRENLKTTQM